MGIVLELIIGLYNPYLIWLVCGWALMFIGASKINVKLKFWLRVFVALFFMGSFINMRIQKSLEADKEELRVKEKETIEEKQKLIREADLKKPLTERSYYVEYAEFRRDLQEQTDKLLIKYFFLDSITLDVFARSEEVYFNDFRHMSLEEYRRSNLTIKERVDRSFVSYIDEENDKLYWNVYIPFVDTLYSILEEPKVLYIHEFNSVPSRDSVNWKLSIDYETLFKRDTIFANFSFGDDKITLDRKM